MTIIIMMNPICFKFILAMLMMVLLLMMQVDLVCAEEVRCIEKERQALLQFKDGLIDEGDYGMLSSWGDQEDKRDCCQWKGVGCNNQTSHVEILDIGNFHLSGKIHISLMKLRHLKYVNLSLNDFYDTHIPYFIGSLSNLRYLDLAYSYFVGKIPSQVGSLSNLQYLSLGENWLEGSIPPQLGNLSKLQYLDLSGNGLEGTLPSQLGNLSKLQYLDLSENSLEGTLPSQLGKLSNLQELNLGYTEGLKFVNDNDFRDQWVSNLTSLTLLDLTGKSNLNNSHSWLQTIGKLPKLTKLVLHDCSLSDHLLFSMVPSNFNSSNSLTILDLSFNNFKSSIIFQWLPKVSSNFVELDLSYNLLEGPISYDLGTSMNSSCSLHTLRLNNNNLMEDLSSIVHNLSAGCVKYSLEKLGLSHNQINGRLPDELSTFSCLKMLHLGQNRLNGKIPSSFRFPPQLEYLDIGSNSLKGVITDSHFANLSMLKHLDLSDNQLALKFSQNWVPSFQLDTIQLRSCKLGPSFPKWLRTQFNFSSLDISNAGISGTVPEWFWALSSTLESMNISHNILRGTIPPIPLRLTGYPNINIILAANHFEGPVPPFLRNAVSLDLSHNKFSDFFLFLCANDTDKSLGQLDLSNNCLSGQIPDCWNNFESLAYLDLSNNNLSGQVPSTIGSTNELQALILRNNSLSGELPFSLKSCTNLVMLDVGENKLSGLVPSWIGSNFQQLQMLSLRRNLFSGNLPLSLCYLKNIHLLDLSSNNLNGQIPKCFKNFSAMTQEDFSKYPVSHYYLVNKTHERFSYDYEVIALLMWKGVERTFNNDKLLLKGIDLSNNQLTKEIPAEIESLVALVSLNLSRNNLTGKIPMKIGRLTSLEFLDLSRNQLIGSIPSSLTHIDRLTMLDLSHNYLSGEIPTDTQLQSFDASSYEDNLDLCGRPLPKLCKVGEPIVNEPLVKYGKDEDSFLGLGFYISMAVGFVIGFWGVFGPILVKHSWRHAYFRFLNNVIDNIYVMIAIKVAKYKMWLNN